jgi:hypothetical protein
VCFVLPYFGALHLKNPLRYTFSTNVARRCRLKNRSRYFSHPPCVHPIISGAGGRRALARIYLPLVTDRWLQSVLPLKARIANPRQHSTLSSRSAARDLNQVGVRLKVVPPLCVEQKHRASRILILLSKNHLLLGLYVEEVLFA